MRSVARKALGLRAPFNENDQLTRLQRRLLLEDGPGASGRATPGGSAGWAPTGLGAGAAALFLFLFLAFMSMASSPGTDIKVLATGLAAGILLDATVIRALLVPAVVSLFGRWNWVLPRFAARVLRVAPSTG